MDCNSLVIEINTNNCNPSSSERISTQSMDIKLHFPIVHNFHLRDSDRDFVRIKIDVC